MSSLVARSRPLIILVALGTLLRVYFGVSLLLIAVLGLLLCCVFAGSSPNAMEQFVPIYRPGTADGLKWGVAAVQGRRPYMEDMHQVVHFHDGEGAFTEGAAAADRVGLTHFFAVFDGHGGKRAAEWAHANLVGNLLKELMGSSLGKGDAHRCLETSATAAFVKTDAEFLRQAKLREMPDGSTAITCMLQQLPGSSGGRRLLVANLGDSRAVLVQRNGSAAALSDDHKPNRPDERARVQAAGGRVIFAGCWRVQGDLAVSRAFGDRHLKGFGVSAQPELKSYTVGPQDAWLVLASDGLWDVVDEAMCGNSCARAHDPLEAARTLCDLASTRGSMDNITVLVVAL
mmetsp:Transcript_37861/g.99373  ORF Transcript_37861/g.99373 Transcript_37861/m.99373 type:complete len:344 (+) Transcript_37861:84-1115(+)